MSDLGNKQNNGPNQDKDFGNPTALYLALLAKNWIQLPGGLMHPVSSL